MAIVFVKCTKIESNANTAALAVTSTAGNALICAIAALGTTYSVSGGGTWTTDKTGTAGTGGFKNAFASCPSATGGSQTITVSVTGNPGITAFVMEFSGMAASGIYEGSTTTGSGNGTTFTTSALTNTQATAVKVAVTGNDSSLNSAFSSTGTGWTLPTNGSEPDGSTWLAAACAYKIVSASQSDTETWTRTGTVNWVADIATYLDPGGGAAQDTPELYGRPDGLGGQRTMIQLLAQ